MISLKRGLKSQDRETDIILMLTYLLKNKFFQAIKKTKVGSTISKTEEIPLKQDISKRYLPRHFNQFANLQTATFKFTVSLLTNSRKIKMSYKIQIIFQRK